MELSDFYYDFPKDLIAQEPLKERDKARLMVVTRISGSIEDMVFTDVIGYLEKGDCLVLNDTKVVNARLAARRKTGAKVEVFLLDTEAKNGSALRALVAPSARIKEGEEVLLESGGTARIGGRADAGRFVTFDMPLGEILKKGRVPLPPYVERNRKPEHARLPGGQGNRRIEDEVYYQTVYAKRAGATASPTAGLHFTENLLEKIRAKGVKTVFVTLHTSYGTFAPVKEENIEDHVMHPEFYEITEEAAAVINGTKKDDGRIFAVGTTSARTLESASDAKGLVAPKKGYTNLFIYPGYKFKAINVLITNFHLPCSTLLMLVSAFAGLELTLRAYRAAIGQKYRFFSYGDAMLIL